jgi:AcrR family transcriptional regulator
VGHREQKKERIRQEIKDAALALFRERGFEQTRVQDVAEQVGISEATFFNYFATKDAVLVEHAGAYLDTYIALLADEVSRAEGSVPDRLREIADLLALPFSEDRDFLAETVSRTGLLFGATGAMVQRTKDAYDTLTALVALGQQRGEIRTDVDPTQLAEVYTGTYIITITNWLTGWWPDAGEDLGPRLRKAIDVFLDGACTTAPTPAARRLRRAEPS